MPGPRELLRRFRPALAPGSVSALGVPADRILERDAELAVVFAQLDDVQTQATQLCATAEADAAAGTDAARSAAQAILAQGHRDADAQRATAAAAVARRVQDEGIEVLAAARCEAQRTADLAERRMPELLDAAAGLMRAMLEDSLPR